jgi:hypothetical protein
MLRDRSMSEPRLDFGLRMASGLEGCVERLGDSVGKSSGDAALLLSDSTYEVSFSLTRRRASANWLANSSVSSSVAVLLRSMPLEARVSRLD